ncbi:MoaD/ThiS family protein [Pseudobacteriovorax antillogorgiicola]|uniref:Molybdopterin converting factor, subunit 1 n=1 Tax=Pseudobacteriovorax antillogorgiicola TaxID=1513793 RepID=A0A1Y6CAB6_9BACT|nr:MoaD/ThiS family protein [Pseudobacteriovorax antillogorgiicola]TCS49012.1 molybdopterin converting factor subunit 1 [Pseudobacteriovorax antillogorgiicola]SMF53082.1 molybdopterin converting factor, subunit 1 [Pseudobacteriovorax antillogorgiicola]
MKTVRLQYYALFREKAARESEEVQTTARTAGDLYEELAERYHFGMGAKHVRVAVNESFQGMDVELNPGDHLVFIPPVSGG